MAIRVALLISGLVGPIAFGSSLRGPGPAEKVKVQFYGESGCPNCQDFVAGPLHQTLNARGLVDVLDLEVFPWGNAYYVTEKCGGGDEYSVNVRHCYNDLCGKDAATRPSDCFKGAPMCQHGEPECIANRYLVCAKNVTKGELTVYMPFLHCVEAGYLEEGTEAQWKGVAEQCATMAAMAFDPVRTCYEGNDGDELLKLQASVTPQHPGVPYVVVNGKALQEGQEDYLLQVVCGAYRGAAKPAGCNNVTSMVF